MLEINLKNGIIVKKSADISDKADKALTCKTEEMPVPMDDYIMCKEEQPCEKAVYYANLVFCNRTNIGWKYNGDRSKS